MADEFEQIGGFLSRWSKRKLEKTKPDAASAPAGPAPAPTEPATGSSTGTPPEAATEAATEAPREEPLPPVESLTPDSDFAPFMRTNVDPDVKTAALKQLFKDPRYNVIDVLDTYIEDYSIPDPIPAAMMKTMYQAREHLFSDEEKAQADAEDAAAEEKALADAADAMDAENVAAAEDLQRELEALDAQAQTEAPACDTDPMPSAESAAAAPRADPPAPDRKDA